MLVGLLCYMGCGRYCYMGAGLHCTMALRHSTVWELGL
jgi:hypothetical protein